MQTFKFHRSNTNLFDSHHINLVYNQDMLLPFIGRVFTEDNIIKQIVSKKSFSQESRQVLVDSLLSQYNGLSVQKEVNANIQSLKDSNTYTITTGHQLSLYTGPLYFVVKILHVIKQCQILNKNHFEFNFVPVYWMASEDHDFEEIQSFKLFNQELKWDSNQGGAVGRFNLEGLEDVKVELRELFKNGEQELFDLIDSLQGDNYATAMRSLVNSLFGRYGLVIMDGDEPKLKQSFLPIFKKELKDQFSFEAVSISNAELKKNGGKIQVNPREVNLFYLANGIRSRIVKDGHLYKIAGVGEYTLEEILKLAEENPESFSPNVILRPLYQEYILPNLVYIGGGGELSYWLQLKRVFESANVIYPLIQVRNSVLWIDSNLSKKISKFDLLLEDVFKSEDLLKKEYIESNESDTLDFEGVRKKTEELLIELDSLIVGVDQSLRQFSEAEAAKLNKQIENIRSKVIKASKSKHENAMKAIELIKTKLFPENGLQERKVNFFNFCMKGNVNERLDILFSALEPFENDLIVIREA